MRHVGKAHRKRIVPARGTADPHAEPGTDADEDRAEQGCGKRHIGKLRPQGRKLLTDPVRQSIPEKWRNILDECCVEAGKWEQENAENDEASMIEFLKDKGVEWNDVDIDAFTEACAPVYDWIVDEYGADPELHQKLVDFLNDYRAKNE